MSHDYKQEREEDLKNIRNKFNDFFNCYKEFCKEWEDLFPEYNETLFKQEMLGLMLSNGCKLNIFTYSDIVYRCGDSGGEFSGFITFLNENELKLKMREYIDKLNNKMNYCHHKFFSSMTEYGINIQSYSNSPDIIGNFLENEICLDNIGLKEILGDEEYSKIIKAFQEEKTRKLLEEQAKSKKLKEDAEKVQYELLKKKFG